MRYGEHVTREQLGAEIAATGSEFERNGAVDILRMREADRGRYNWYMNLHTALLYLANGWRTSIVLNMYGTER
jgi:hypothetical protein